MNRHGDWTIFHYQIVSSTQHIAAELVRGGMYDHAVVVATRQTAGYGRKGDDWRDEPGSALLATLILRPDDARNTSSSTMIAALAIADAILTLTGLRAEIKWPNDVLLNRRKVAGILADASWIGMTLEALRIGIGVNVGGSREAFIVAGLPMATSIAAETGQSFTVETTLDTILDHFTRLEAIVASEGTASIVAAWRDALTTLGKPVIATMVDGTVIQGTARDIAEDGSLLVMTNSGCVVTLRSAAVRSLRHK